MYINYYAFLYYFRGTRGPIERQNYLSADESGKEMSDLVRLSGLYIAKCQDIQNAVMECK
jgi:hypothetical protein